jgi:FkbM family methyltransferase
MVKTNKLSNLKRLNFKNKRIVLFYLIKTILKIKPTQIEFDVYSYYNILINANGYFFDETQNSYVSDFSDNFQKRIKIRKRPSSDIAVFKQINIYKEYLPAVKAYQDNFFNDKYVMNIIDAGSNIGLTSLFFLDHFKNVDILCIEPELENFKILEFNLLRNNNCKIVKINGAIWSSDTKIKIVKDFRDKSDWSFRVEETEDENGIQAHSINQLINNYNIKFIDILKIDIEGAEKQVFTSKYSDLNFLNITKCIAMEIHDEFNCREDIYKVLTDYGYTLVDSGEITIAINKNLIK